MGSGKSVVAKALSEKTGYTSIDMDDQIALIEQQSISEIFNSKGELYFRKRENQVLQDVLEEPGSLIVSLGGGTPCYGNNMDMIKNSPDSRMIYLKASVEFLTDRLFLEKEHRPVISHLTRKEDLEDFIRKHLFERGFYYLQSDQIINVEGKEIQSIVEDILVKSM